MISFISGILTAKSPTEAIIDCNGVGYQIFISVNTSNQLPNIGETASLNTLLLHKEDSMQLFGFQEKNEREMFVLLNSISGIGPRSAISILSSMNVADLKYAIAKGNLLLLQKMPGIGKKTAERIIIELKDKVNKVSTDDYIPADSANSTALDTVAALVALGYNRNVAEQSVKKAIESTKDSKTNSVEELIRLALKFALN